MGMPRPPGVLETRDFAETAPEGQGRLVGGSVHCRLSASSALRLGTQSEDTVVPALLQSERHFLGGATLGVRQPDGMNPGLDLQAKTWVGEGREGPAQVSSPVHVPYPHVTWLGTQETSMGSLLTPRPHCPAPQDPCKEVGADWSKPNPGEVKDTQLRRPSRDNKGKG